MSLKREQYKGVEDDRQMMHLILDHFINGSARNRSFAERVDVWGVDGSALHVKRVGNCSVEEYIDAELSQVNRLERWYSKYYRFRCQSPNVFTRLEGQIDCAYADDKRVCATSVVVQGVHFSASKEMVVTIPDITIDGRLMDIAEAITLEHPQIVGCGEYGWLRSLA